MTSDAKQAELRARLYARYSTEQAGVRPEQLQSALRAREPYLKALITRWVPSDPGTRIFDLGCGSGAILYSLKKLGYASLGGVDVSPEQVELAHQLGVDCVAAGELRAALLHIPAASLDVIFAFDVLEHLTREELLETGDLVHRALAPGGRLIVHLPNASGLFSGIIRYDDLTHHLAFTPSSLRQFGNACGLRLLAVQEDVPIAHGFLSLARKLIWQIGTFPLRLLMIAENPDMRGRVVLSQNMSAVFDKN